MAFLGTASIAGMPMATSWAPPPPNVTAFSETISIVRFWVTASLTVLMRSNSFHDGPAKQACRFDDQYGDNQRQCDRQFQFIADAGDVGTGEILEDADQKASDHRAKRA